MAWYQSHSNGDWEHQFGVHITTLDNPGWALDVDLAGTHDAERVVPMETVERSQTDWVFVEVKDAKFHARGGPGNLGEMILRFAAFVSSD
jgi:hypothetical protein